MENSNGTAKLIGALVVGTLAGAALGILFAPEKGIRTRKNIIDGAKDLAGDIKRKMTDEAAALRKKANDLEELAKDKMDDLTDAMNQKAEETVKG